MAPRPEPQARGLPLTNEATDSLEHLRRRVAVSITPSACPALLSTSVDKQGVLKRRIHEYMLHRDYHQSIRGEDDEESIEAIGSPTQTDMDSYYYFRPPTTLANTASLSKRSRGSPWPAFPTPTCEDLTWQPGNVNTRNMSSRQTSTPQGREFPYPGASLWCSRPYVRTAGQTVIWIRRAGRDISV